ncbi:MAG TPA: Ig-like domain-containing protein [Gemmatimonadales bacterium]|nr:Ig-like domain-containing protein [Gemmatimonadales bacterium]
MAGSITCGGGDSLEVPDEPVPASVKVLHGDAQQGLVGEPLPDSIVVQVTDADGRPVPGRAVSFLSLTSIPGASFSPKVATTDSAGRASALPILGRQPGPWPVEAQVSVRNGRVLTAELSLTATVGAPDSLVRVRGEDQGGRVSQTLTDSLVVEVVDRFDNPVPGVAVDWSAQGGGQVSGAETETGADGRTGVTRRLGARTGAQSTVAAVASLKGSPLVFHHTALPGDAAVLIAIGGGGQEGQVGTVLADPLEVRAEDADGNPIAGREVQWAVTSGGGSADPATSVTDTDGTTATRWTLGDGVGAQTLAARMAGLPDVVFSASAGAGAPAGMTIETQPSAAAGSGAAFSRQPVVQLRDAGGNPVASDDIEVTVALGDNPGGTLAGGKTVSTRNGVATFTNLSITGAVGSYTLRFIGAGLSGATSAAIALGPSSPAALAIRRQPPATATAWQTLATQPIIEVRDGGGNPLDGIRVDASIQGGGSLIGGTSATTSQGVATFTDLGIGGGAGTRTLRFSAGGVSVDSRQITVNTPTEATVGSWSPVMSWPVVAVHLHLLPDGTVLSWGKFGDPQVWNPATGNFTAVPSPALLFCAGHAFLPDGRLLVTGGHISNDHGLPAATLFDWRTRSWSTGPAMSWGRWYPTSTTLPNGEVLTLAGRDESGTVVTTPEVWLTGGGWRKLTSAPLSLPYYPRAFVAPNGKVFVAGPAKMSHYLSTSGNGSWTNVGPMDADYRDYGGAVMYAPGKVLTMGGGGADSNSAPTATAEVIDLTSGSPAWRRVGSMAKARRHLNAVLLPTGDVLVTGGTSAAGFDNPAGAVFAAELWNPGTEKWTTLASNQVIRMYHSTSILLPDGRVLHTGSGDGAGAANERNAEIFSPPYLFRGPRPEISSAPSTVSYGQTVAVGTPQASGIGKVTLIRLGSATHAFDENERLVPLAFTAGATSLSVTMPATGNIAPPGHYMLFVVSTTGVPSVARIVQLR